MARKLRTKFLDLYEQLANEGKAFTFPADQCASFDSKLAKEMEKIKTDFNRRERGSRAAVANSEMRCNIK